MFLIHFKKVDMTISSVISFNARVIHKTISSSNGFLWWLVTVNPWIPFTIHCIQLFHFCRNTMGYRTEANLGGIRAILELSFIGNTAFTFQSHDLQRYHKQVGFHISPGHHIMHAKLRKTFTYLLIS